MLNSLIDEFEQGGQRLRSSVSAVDAADCTKRVPPGLWSIHEVVVHLADSDSIAIDRMKRILTEENPTLFNADESAYVERLHCNQQSLEDALSLFELGRRQFARVLRSLEPSDFERIGTHNVVGQVTLGDLVQTYVDHLTNHLEFIDKKRAKLKDSL